MERKCNGFVNQVYKDCTHKSGTVGLAESKKKRRLDGWMSIMYFVVGFKCICIPKTLGRKDIIPGQNFKLQD